MSEYLHSILAVLAASTKGVWEGRLGRMETEVPSDCVVSRPTKLRKKRRKSLSILIFLELPFKVIVAMTKLCHQGGF